jgi:hypothetical protein
VTKGLKNIQITFVEDNITRYGGLYLLNSFCKKLNLKWYLQSYVKIHQANQKYQTAEFLLILIYTIILGIKRIESIKYLQTNGVTKKLIGIERIPDNTAIRRFLYSLTPDAIRQIVKVHNLIQKKIFLRIHTKTSITLDIDGTVLTVFGKQQRAKVGYNPKRKGARSYMAMLCFESDKEFWYGSLYHGSVSQVKVARHIIKRCLKKLPYPIYRIRVRADAGFYSFDFIDNFLDKESIGYSIEAEINKVMFPFFDQALYTEYRNGWEVAEFTYKSYRAKVPHRFVIQRRPLPKDPDEKLQLKLFERKNYGYRVLITNLPLKPRSVWDFHSQRSQGAELNIKELKLNYTLNKIPTKYFLANVAYLQIVLFAFNIVNWFKWLCLPNEYHYATLHTIREQLLSVAARLTKTDNKNFLNFPRSYQYQDLFNFALKKISKMHKL